MIEILPSILSADFANLGEAACEAETAGVKAIQIDVMDGRFVPNITFGSAVVSALRSKVKLFLDIHLMIVEPERHLEKFKKAGSDRIIVHQEPCLHLHRTLQSIREMGMESGVALNPATPLNTIIEVMDLADVIQVMTVNPGFGGQPFIHSQRSKIRHLKQMLNEQGLKATIAVDGGINPETAPLVVSDGATLLVAGSSIYNSKGTVAQNIDALRKSIEIFEKKEKEKQ